jgi:hypothetical protein
VKISGWIFMVFSWAKFWAVAKFCPCFLKKVSLAGAQSLKSKTPREK